MIIIDTKHMDINPPAELENIIFTRIREEARRSARMRFIGTTLLSLGSFISLIPSFMYFMQNIRTSGFYDYLSLFFSDTATLASYWKEFSLSLAESLPFFALTLCLALAGICIWSASRATRDARLLAA